MLVMGIFERKQSKHSIVNMHRDIQWRRQTFFSGGRCEKILIKNSAIVFEVFNENVIITKYLHTSIFHFLFSYLRH